KAVVLGFGINPLYGKQDPYRMAASVIDESLRNLVAAGGDIQSAVLLDNFCFGDVSDEKILGALLMSTKACYDYAITFGTPYISGKDSLNNFFTEEKRRFSIPSTLLISSIAVIPDYRNAMTSNFKGEGNLIYLVGETKDELGGSEFMCIMNVRGVVPSVDKRLAPIIFKKVSKGIREGLFLSVHDLSSGGLGVALAEMGFSNGIGCKVNLREINRELRDDILLFSESNSRFLIEVEDKKHEEVKRLFKGVPHYLIGRTVGNSLVISNGDHGIIDLPVDELYKRWKKAINW
ncbi:phosphoribosylformylglycinamidine synthase, partial [candidate division WOR-3 bacterium]|nr:phosphoribosylformylglycinamidine synthase [candidate division WOR-3 bacterium]